MGLSELQSTMNICILRKILIGATSEVEILLLKDVCELAVQRRLSINSGKQKILCHGYKGWCSLNPAMY